MEEIIQSPAAKNLSSLKKYLKQLALLEKGFVIEKGTLQQLPARKETGIQVGVLQFSANETLKEIERKLIEQVLEEEDFNQTKAAKRLGINRATLWRKLKE
ncbi:helix-turn-helix domain-containing protein [Planococcus chinensis]|uniref:Helix-turn-helix domain-containing protein n=1 Tax=Planococcus chinensis TaxID=272917 RepID=A0ABW4QF00_9BACL